jgi:hypothetical protein
MVEGDNPGLIKEQSQGSHQVSRKVDEGQRINEIRRKIVRPILPSALRAPARIGKQSRPRALIPAAPPRTPLPVSHYPCDHGHGRLD